jgi:hypothetical protein
VLLDEFYLGGLRVARGRCACPCEAWRVRLASTPTRLRSSSDGPPKVILWFTIIIWRPYLTARNYLGSTTSRVSLGSVQKRAVQMGYTATSCGSTGVYFEHPHDSTGYDFGFRASSHHHWTRTDRRERSRPETHPRRIAVQRVGPTDGVEAVSALAPAPNLSLYLHLYRPENGRRRSAYT